MYAFISGFSDEIDANVDVQFTALQNLGIRYFEPRGVDGKNIASLTDEEAKTLKEKMDRYGIRASSIGSPIGKIKIADDFSPHEKLFEQTLKIAKILDAKSIRIFSFYHDGDVWTEQERSEVFSRLEKMIKRAEKENIILLHENEKGIYGDIAERCLDLMKVFYGSHFKAVFDPANFVQCGEDTNAAFDSLSPYIAYMHIKDADENGNVVPAGWGRGNVRAILEKLKGQGYNGFLSLEPHLGSFTGLEALETDDKMEKLEKSSAGKFELAYTALQKILDEIHF